jgi:hydroxypyruvate isomerase
MRQHADNEAVFVLRASPSLFVRPLTGRFFEHILRSYSHFYVVHSFRAGRTGMVYLTPMERRTFLTSAAVPLVTGIAGQLSAQTPAPARGRIKQSVMASVWTGSTTSFEERCKILARIGFKGVDLPTEKQVPILTQNGLAPGMMTGTGTNFQNGLIRKELHDMIEAATHAGIDVCASVGCSVLIAIPGERRGMSREEGADNAVAILNRVKGYAEQKGINVCMEVTNSKIAADQRTDQVFDHVGWGLDVCKRVNSPRVKILYDIYHAQIMDGDITRTLSSPTLDLWPMSGGLRWGMIR